MRRAIGIRLAHGRTGLPRTLEPSRCSGAIEAARLPRDRVLALLARTFEFSTRHRMLERYMEGSGPSANPGGESPIRNSGRASINMPALLSRRRVAALSFTLQVLCDCKQDKHREHGEDDRHGQRPNASPASPPSHSRPRVHRRTSQSESACPFCVQRILT